MQPNENQSRNPNHPKRGSSIKVNPITELSAIKRIKQQLANKPRDLCLFTLGINTAYRANELVSIKVGQVDYLKTQDRLDLKQSKNKKYRSITLNATAIEAIQNWLEVHPDVRPDAPLFISAKTKLAINSVTVTSMVKAWCSKAGLRGNFGSHTLRKTWGYHQRKTFHRPIVLLTQAYGHSSEAQTLAYLCIQREEIEALYSSAL
ncbi:tyrosine-type recombinase/integrase [Porticoccaceae bacterium]|nr:tyrosine-type recombinase/integrase [Porticoccaceae bacterium]